MPELINNSIYHNSHALQRTNAIYWIYFLFAKNALDNRFL